jgi:hypothetical protein
LKLHVPFVLKVKFHVPLVVIKISDTSSSQSKTSRTHWSQMKLNVPLGLRTPLQQRLNSYLKVHVIVHFKHVEVQRPFHLKQILFIPRREGTVKKVKKFP